MICTRLYIVFPGKVGYNVLRYGKVKGVGIRMEQEGQETLKTREPSWTEDHPWLAFTAGGGEEDTVEEVIRYTLDELRLA